MREKTCFFLNFALQISVSYDKFYLLFVGKGPTTEGRNNRMGGGGGGGGGGGLEGYRCLPSTLPIKS